MYMPRQFRLSIRLSVFLSHVRIVSKRLNASSKFFHYLIAFRHRGSLRKSDGFILNGAPNIRGGVTIFDQCAAISRKR